MRIAECGLRNEIQEFRSQNLEDIHDKYPSRVKVDTRAPPKTFSNPVTFVDSVVGASF